MKKLLFYLMILLTGFFGFSQQEKFQNDIAALKSLIVIAQKDKNINNELFFRYKLLGLEIKNVNYNQAYLEGLAIEEIIISNPTSDSVISLSPRFYKTMGWIMTSRVQYEKSIEYYKKAIQFARGQNKSHFIFDVKVSIAFCSHLLGKKKEAHKLAKNLMKEAKEQNDEMLISKGHYLYYLLFNEERDYENSLYHIKLCQLGPSISEKAFRLINIGTAYLNIQNIDSALVYTLKGLKIAEDSNENQIQANAHIQLKTIYLKLEDYKNAMYHSEKFNQIMEKSASFKAGMELVKINNEILEEKIKLQQELSSEKLKNQRLIIWLILIALLLHISGIIYTLNKIKIIEKQKILIEKEKIKAEESKKYKEQFLANMSHEIRTPMHAISGITNILLRKKHPKELDRYLDAMKISSDNLLILLDDILDLSKIESGKLQIEHVLMNPITVIDNVIKVLGYSAKEKGLKLITTINDDVPSQIVGDSFCLNQILVNLVNNSIKFTESGSVTLSCSVKISNNEKSLLFTVSDTGIGIPKEKINTIFEIFEQGEKSMSQIFKGTGLGLSISKKLIELQGGTIWVESEPGYGSQFHFTLPLITESGEQLKAAIVESDLFEIGKKLKGIKILLGEDDEFNVMVIHDDLDYYIPEVQLEIANNGEEVLKKYQNEQFDIIIMDMHMPIMSGLEATQIIRNLEKEKAINPTVIIAMSANILKSDIDNYLKNGINDFIHKPYKPQQLLYKLLEHFSNRL